MASTFYRCLLFCLLGVLSASSKAQSLMSDEAVRAQVLAIQSRPSDIERAAAAEDLFDMVKGKNLDHVHMRTIQKMSTLINDDSEGVTMWIAAALGEFRGRASFAAPRLIEMLKRVECRRVDASSEFTLRTALEKMGSHVPESDCSKQRVR